MRGYYLDRSTLLIYETDVEMHSTFAQIENPLPPIEGEEDEHEPSLYLLVDYDLFPTFDEARAAQDRVLRRAQKAMKVLEENYAKGVIWITPKN